MTLYAFYSHAQEIPINDSLYLNYFIATGEFGGNNEGLIIYRDGNNIKAKSVRYNKSSYGKPIEIDTIISFYKRNKRDFTVIKKEWVLSNKQRDYIFKVLDEIKRRPIEENVFSNASEHYTILTKDKNYVFIDRTGNWNKFLEIKEFLDIEQQPKKL